MELARSLVPWCLIPLGRQGLAKRWDLNLSWELSYRTKPSSSLIQSDCWFAGSNFGEKAETHATFDQAWVRSWSCCILFTIYPLLSKQLSMGCFSWPPDSSTPNLLVSRRCPTIHTRSLLLMTREPEQVLPQCRQ